MISLGAINVIIPAYLSLTDVNSSQTEWNLVFAALRSTTSHPEAARLTFDLVLSFVTDGQSQWMTPDNFNGLITILDEFANSAGQSIMVPQRGRRIPSQPPPK